MQERWRANQINGRTCYVLKQKLKCLKSDLKEWNKSVFGNLDRNIEMTTKALNKLDLEAESRELTPAEEESRKSLTSLMWQQKKAKESLLCQKSRFKWLQHGDSNSPFFHKRIWGRRVVNTINGLKVDGNWIHEPGRVEEAVQEHFQKLYSEQWSDRPFVNGIQFPQVSLEENVMLIESLSEEEIKSAVWQCDDYKSPGPDGFNFHFIKTFWDTVKQEFVGFISEFHQNGKLVRGSNSSFLTRVPKIASPQQLSHYRPISMIDSMYKVLSKLMENRLSKVLQKLISQSQSGFLPNGNITEGVLIANEVVDEVKRSNSSCIIFKADIEKAFDSVNWEYIFSMMRSMGFGEIWMGWVRECVISTKIAILVNGSPTNEISMNRGLR